MVIAEYTRCYIVTDISWGDNGSLRNNGVQKGKLGMARWVSEMEFRFRILMYTVDMDSKKSFDY